jgi:hypothetical protein
MKLNSLAVASFTALALSAGATLASTQTFSCGMNHYVRNGGAEMITSAFTIRNRDAMYPATVMRVTFRDIDGNVVYDAGPAIGIPYPLSLDFPNAHPNGRDTAIVPPLSATYLRTNQIWGNYALPPEVGGPEMGQVLSVWIVVSKEGPRNTVAVGASQRIRSRNVSTGQETDTRDTSATDCQLVTP